MRFVENFVWGSSKYMDEIDSIPVGLMANVTKLLMVRLIVGRKNCIS